MLGTMSVLVTQRVHDLSVTMDGNFSAAAFMVPSFILKTSQQG